MGPIDNAVTSHPMGGQFGRGHISARDMRDLSPEELELLIRRMQLNLQKENTWPSPEIQRPRRPERLPGEY